MTAQRQPHSSLSVDLQAEIYSAVQRVERKAYRTGWFYGVLCGLLCGSLTTGLGLLLLHLASTALGDVAHLPGLTT